MRTVLRRLAQGTLAAVLVLAVVALSRVPWEAEPSDDAVLRLAWRFRSPLRDQCRRLSEEELARRPAHMRRAEECERRLIPYRLVLTLDGLPALEDSVGARGARDDRPLSVFREIALPAGRHRVVMTFQPYPEHDDDDDEHDADRSGATAFALDTTITVAPRQVLLLTMDEGASRLEARHR